MNRCEFRCLAAVELHPLSSRLLCVRPEAVLLLLLEIVRLAVFVAIAKDAPCVKFARSRHALAVELFWVFDGAPLFGVVYPLEHVLFGHVALHRVTAAVDIRHAVFNLAVSDFDNILQLPIAEDVPLFLVRFDALLALGVDVEWKEGAVSHVAHNVCRAAFALAVKVAVRRRRGDFAALDCFLFFAVVSHVSFVTSNSKLRLDCWQGVMLADNCECFEHLFLASFFCFPCCGEFVVRIADICDRLQEPVGRATAVEIHPV